MFEDRKSAAKRTELSELGEFGLIDYLTKNFKTKNSSTIKAVGDDAAVVENGEKVTLISTDILTEGIHFDLTYAPLKHLGYKSVIVNLSDIYAMNGVPKQITIGLAISNRFSVEALAELYEGIHLACTRYGVDLVGGDTTSSSAGLFLSITAIGEAKKDKVVYRNGAKEGDLIMVSGDLGGAYIGLLLLEREKSVFKADPNMQPELDGNDYILERQLKPEARKDVIELLAKAGVKPNAMIDISDGLASELYHISTQSKTGCTIYEEKIPIDHQTFSIAREFELDPTTAAFNGGEDYELLFTVSPEDYEKIKDVAEFVTIGHVTDEASGIQLVSKDGNYFPITAQGWDHLKKS